MPEKPQQTVGDYVSIALAPLLIMALVGSLIFFLLEILYAGQYAGRLQWTLFFFVFGIVLIARISIEQGDARASLFGIALGISVFIALQVFVEYPKDSIMAPFSWAINLCLMGLSWWCAHRLTWDCTYIDDKVDASGKGVLEAAGLDAETEDGGSKVEDSQEQGQTSTSDGLLGWWDRYRRYREEQLRKPHTPGVWVVYFSLAALPLFGLGQSLIPPAAVDRRRYVFWLMVCYVASGLGLLLTTSYLGLRRYLRQRNLQMPLATTRVWLVLGGTLVVFMLVFGALLPRPYSEYPLIHITPGGSQDLKSSQFALKHDSAAKGKGDPSSDPSRSDDTADDGQGQQRDDRSSAQTRGDGKSSGSQSGKDGSQSGRQKGNQSGNGKGQQSDSQNSSKGDSEQNQQDSKNASDQGKDGEGQRDQQSGDQSKNDRGKQGESNKNDGQRGKGKTNPLVKEDPRKNQSGTGSGRDKSTPPPPPATSLLSGLARVAKWIVFGILAAFVLVFLFRSGLKFLGNFTNWAKDLLAALDAWWKRLFGRKKREPEPVAAVEATVRRRRPRPFADFSNPFRDGTSAHFSPDELATYSFDALQSWAWERGLGRGPEETPLEFAERLTAEVPALEPEVRGLAGMYARVAYARGRLAATSLPLLTQFWQRLETIHDRPLSA